MSLAKCVTLNNGLEMPLVLFGSFRVKEEDIENVLDAALSCGYRGIDTATVYRNEAAIGAALKKLLPKHNLKREDIWITSKLFTADQGYEKAKVAIDKSLERLQTSYMDLYLVHWPGTNGVKLDDYESLKNNREGSWKAFEEALASGKLRSIGISNYIVKHIEEMTKYAKVMPAVLQSEHHPYLDQVEVREACKRFDIHYQAYSSLGTTDKHQELAADPVVNEIAKETGRTTAQVLLKWAVQNNISVLPKSLNPTHIKENIDLFSWNLSEGQMSKLNSLNKRHHYCWNPNTVS